MSKPFLKVRTEIDSEDVVTFGKHIGHKWHLIPGSYVLWCISELHMNFTKTFIVSSIRKNALERKEVVLANRVQIGWRDDWNEDVPF